MSGPNFPQNSKLPPPLPPDRNISTLPTQLISEEVTELLQKGGKRGNSVCRAGFYQEGWRKVASIQYQSPKKLCEQRTSQNGVHSNTKRSLNKGAKIDLKDAFFSIATYLNHKKFLRFMFKGKTYQFNCLHFSLSLAPCTVWCLQRL